MAAIFRKGMRQQDLSDYVDADQLPPPFTYERIGTAIKATCKSLVRFFRRDAQQYLPQQMRSNCFYTRVQPYRPVPTKPFPPDFDGNLRRIRKGFDPLKMTENRWDKQNALSQEEQQKEKLLERSHRGREREIEDAGQSQPKKKTIKKYTLKELHREDDDYFSWEAVEKKFKLAADAIEKSLHEEAAQKQTAAQVAIPDIPKQTDPEEVLSDRQEQSGSPSTQASTPPEQASPILPISVPDHPVPEKPVDSSPNSPTEQAKTNQQVKANEQEKQKVVENPFKMDNIPPAMKLDDLISKDPRPNPIFANLASSNQQQSNAAASPFHTTPTHNNQGNISNNPQQNHNLFSNKQLPQSSGHFLQSSSNKNNNPYPANPNNPFLGSSTSFQNFYPDNAFANQQQAVPRADSMFHAPNMTANVREMFQPEKSNKSNQSLFMQSIPTERAAKRAPTGYNRHNKRESRQVRIS